MISTQRTLIIPNKLNKLPSKKPLKTTINIKLVNAQTYIPDKLLNISIK